MQEKIVLVPGVRGNEFIKNLAIHGVNCINLKIMGAGELARYALMKSGVSILTDFLSSKEEYTLIAQAIKGEPYFERATYSDIIQIAQAVKRMRSLVIEEEEESILQEKLNQGIFKEKNKALFRTYQNYMKLLKEKNALDSISLIRKAIKESKPFSASFSTLEEYPLSPLELALLQKLSNGNISKECVGDLYHVQSSTLTIESFKNCYGMPNEVEMILHDIYANKELDTCTVAISDDAGYSQLFFDYALLYDLPVTFGCGIPIINSNPAKLLVLYYHWITDGFFGKAALDQMLHSKAFNKKVWKEQFPEPVKDFSWKKFYEVLSNLRFTNKFEINIQKLNTYKKSILEEEDSIPSDNKMYKDFIQRKLCIPYLEIAAKELALMAEDFISKYAYIRKGSNRYSDQLLMKLDMFSVDAIYDELGIIRKSSIVQSADDMITNVLKMGVCGETSEPGKLHITDMSNALISTREHLYIAGLSASKFPGSPKENYLLLDADIECFGSNSTYLTSQGKIKQKREQLLSLVHLASNLGNKIYLSYAGLNVSELKKDNASSMLFELYKEEAGNLVTMKELENRIQKVDYFEPAISATREIGKSYNAGEKIMESTIDSDLDLDVKVDLDKYWSPSAINMFLADPQQFMLVYLLNIPQPDETNPFDILSPIGAGNLAHSLMERLANTDMSKEEFIQLSEEYFNRYIDQNPPLITEKIEEEKMEFVDMMERAYDMDPHREVVLKEEDIRSKHESGINLHGLPDRVEKLEDGSYIVVDFKSGRNVKHIEDDIQSCLQGVIYSYLMEQEGFPITRSEFRYIRTGDVISCQYDDSMKDKLKEVLCAFKKCLEEFKFEPIEDFNAFIELGKE